MIGYRWLALLAFGLFAANAGAAPAKTQAVAVPMPAYEHGIYLLTIENYTAAEGCFLRVTEKFPECPECWANLGLARLMKYCDGLSADDLRKLGIGQFVAGVRFCHSDAAGSDEKLKRWKAAEAALQTALKLKSGSATVLVNLGLAYLVCPEKRDESMKRAEEYLNKAYAIANDDDSDTEPEALSALLINRGVIRLANGETDDGFGLILKAKTLSKKFAAADKDAIQQAVLFNTALAFRADGKNAKASEAMKQYLQASPSGSPWWNVAHGIYLELQKALGEKPLSKEELAGKANPERKHFAVQLADGESIQIGDSIKNVSKKLGKPAAKKSVEGTAMTSLHYPALGLAMIVEGKKVCGFSITGDKGPKIAVKEKGANGKIFGELRLGMTRKEVSELASVGDWVSRCFTHMDRTYSYSPELGVALLYGKDGKKDTVIGMMIGN